MYKQPLIKKGKRKVTNVISLSFRKKPRILSPAELMRCRIQLTLTSRKLTQPDASAWEGGWGGGGRQAFEFDICVAKAKRDCDPWARSLPGGASPPASAAHHQSRTSGSDGPALITRPQTNRVIRIIPIAPYTVSL